MAKNDQHGYRSGIDGPNIYKMYLGKIALD